MVCGAILASGQIRLASSGNRSGRTGLPDASRGNAATGGLGGYIADLASFPRDANRLAPMAVGGSVHGGWSRDRDRAVRGDERGSGTKPGIAGVGPGRRAQPLGLERGKPVPAGQSTSHTYHLATIRMVKAFRVGTTRRYSRSHFAAWGWRLHRALPGRGSCWRSSWPHRRPHSCDCMQPEDCTARTGLFRGCSSRSRPLIRSHG